MEWNNLTRINHIDERIAHIAFVLLKVLVNLIRDISQVYHPKKVDEPTNLLALKSIGK